MNLSGAVQRLEHAVLVCGEPDPSADALTSALRATTEVQGFIDARRAELMRTLKRRPTSFPEATVADTSGCSLNHAAKETERAETLDAALAMGEALSDGRITSGHVDALTRAARNLDDAVTAELFGDDESLATAASTSTVAQFDAFVKRRARALDRTNGEERLARQRRATRLRTWTDADGMWNLTGRFDPDVGKDLARQLAERSAAKFAEQTPDTAPDDPIERRQHLDALALADLVLDRNAQRSRPGAPIVVVDATQTDGVGGPMVDWGIPVELPRSVLLDVLGQHDPEVVVVANGVVLHAPGKLDLGRASRLANRAQRRALAGLYATCAIPGCTTHYDRCRLHHVIFWEHGGRTDLDNLLPVCARHHGRIHHDDWKLTLDANRELTISLADGQTMHCGPPKRGAA